MKVLVADDHAVVRKGLIQIIKELPETILVDEVDNGSDVITKVNLTKYDLLVLDLSMPDKNGFDILKELRTWHPKLKILILSTYPEELFAVRTIKLGASGYLNKNSAPEELVNAIRQVASGKKYISAVLANQIADQIGEISGKLPHELLSNRELEVFRLFAEGKTSIQIAEELSLSFKTISTHKTNILKKMNLKGSADIAIYAISNKLFLN